MLRSIVAVIVTYIVMTIIVVGLFMGLWFGVGPDRLLLPGSWKGGVLITVAAPGITAVGGLFGGWMCAKIGRGRGPVLALAGVVFAVGMISAYFTLQKPFPSDPREPGMTMAEVMKKGREPTWVALSNPIIGAVGVLAAGISLTGARKAA